MDKDINEESASHGATSMMAWRRLNSPHGEARLTVDPKAAPMLVLRCTCGNSTVTRHYTATIASGWQFDKPKDKVGDFYNVHAVCPVCAKAQEVNDE